MHVNKDILNQYKYSFIVLLFFVIGLLNILNHEMWRDEFQAWLIAVQSNSLADLANNLRYESEPGLWHFLLFIITRFTDNWISMQILNLSISTATVFLIARYSPFTYIQKFLFAFSYFILYEYGTISRSYALEVFFVFSICALWSFKPRNVILVSVTLFLMSMVNVFGLIIALCFGIYLITEYLRNNEYIEPPIKRAIFFISVAIFLSGIIISIITMMPPHDSGFKVGWLTKLHKLHLLNTISSIWRAYVPIPQFTMNIFFWNTNIFDGTITGVMLSIILFLASLAILSRTPSIVFLYSVITIGLLILFYTKNIPFIRHHGHLFIIFAACLWLSEIETKKRSLHFTAHKIITILNNHKNLLVTVILSFQFFSGIYASVIDWRYQFSGSNLASSFIKKAGMDRSFIVGHIDYTASTISAYLNKPIYYPAGNRFGTFIIFDKDRTAPITYDDIIRSVNQLMEKDKKDVLIVLNTPLGHSNSSELPYRIEFISAFTESMVVDEIFFIYVARYDYPNSI